MGGDVTVFALRISQWLCSDLMQSQTITGPVKDDVAWGTFLNLCSLRLHVFMRIHGMNFSQIAY